MLQEPSFGKIIKEHRRLRDLTQAELARRVGCATITIRKIEADALRPSVQIAERLAMSLGIPLDERADFVRLARIAALADQSPPPMPTPPVAREEIGQEDLSGRAIRGYQLGERIGVGGYGVIYRAIQPLVEREVAVKIVLPQYADHPDFIRRFEVEAQLVARLEHPYIVPLYDFWREPGVAYLVMRLMRGGSLHSKLKAGPLPFPMTLKLLQQIGSALHNAHQAGIMHRDLKPANILLDEDDNAYLADFGFAKNLSNPDPEEQTQAGTIIGTLEYISPEQIQAESIRPQTDIYCLGVMLYELLTGRKPFKGSTPLDYIQQHLQQPFPSLATLVQEDVSPAVDPVQLTAFDPVIAKATAKDPANRYPDVLALLADIEQAMATLSANGRPLVPTLKSITDSGYWSESSDHPLENPYKGLRPFSEADADDFFGRETLIQELLGRLAEADDPVASSNGRELGRFMAVVGPSGSGKSSVVKAGLIPALRRGALPGSENWFIVDFIPGLHPLEELEAALLRVAVNPPESLLAQLQESERGLLRAVKRILPVEQGVELLLVIDQFEEVFTLMADEAARAHFLASLVATVLDPRSQVRVIITLRADFVDRPLQYVDFGELVRQRTEFVLPLTPDELEEAITQPTTRSGMIWEPGLAATIIQEVGAQPGTLPLLQYALTELFERREGRRLTLAAYHQSGGVLGALARRADEIYEGLDEAGQAASRQLFLRLITLGEGVEDTRRRVLRGELASIQPPSNSRHWGEDLQLSPLGPPKGGEKQGMSPSGGVGGLDAAISQFGRYRLLTFDHDPVTRSPTVEVAHEALIREWNRLRTWLADSRDDVRLQRLLASAAAEWREADQNTGFLLRGARLDQFEGWAEGAKVALTRAERLYLRASLVARQKRRAAEEVRQQRELETAQKLAATEAQAARRFRWLAVGLAVFLVVALGLSWFAFNQRNEAQTQTARAEENFTTSERIRLAAQAQIALDNGEGGDLPALLALHSLKHGYSSEADAALLSALQRGFTRQQYLGHTDDIRMVDFSPDGQYLLTASDDLTARLWDAQTGEELHQFTGHTAPLTVATFSSDGQYILTGSLDNTARLWDARTKAEVRRFEGHLGGVWGAAFTPDGQFIVTSDSMMARRWDVQTGDVVQRFEGHTDSIFWLDISVDGRYLATFSGDRTARLWDLQTGQELRQFVGHTEWVGGGQLSADGRYLVTTSHDQTARLWDTQTGRELRRFVGHTDDLFDARFSYDGRYLVTTSYDKTAIMWDIASGREVRKFLGHTDYVSVPMFSVDDRYLLTGSGDRTARLWEVWSETEPQTLASFIGGYHQDLYTLTPSSDQKVWATAWTGGTVQFWNAENNQVFQSVDFQTATINVQTISSDNRFILAGDNEGIIGLAEAQTGQVIRRFGGHFGPVRDIVYAPDGEYALSGSDDRTARLWQVETGQEVMRLLGHDGPIRAVAFSPNGQYILTGGDDHTARLWDRESGRELRRLAGHTARVLDVAFSADGRFILTGSADNIARRWAIDSDQGPQTFVGHTDQVTHVALSPNGRYALTASLDQSVRLWDAETTRLVRHIVGHTSPVLFIDFAPDGQSIITGNARVAYSWRLSLEDVIDFTCTQLSRDFTAEERALYNISDQTPTCPEFDELVPEVEPTWTPVPPGSIKREPLVLSDEVAPSEDSIAASSSTPITVEIEFLTDAANLTMDAPMQDVYIEAGEGQIVRPQDVEPETLALPLYKSTERIEPDFMEPPYEAGPFPQGGPLGITLAEWLAATGEGTYTVIGDRAIVDFTFTNLIPNGVYTLWCAEVHLPPEAEIINRPCGAPDGTENTVPVDENGYGEIRLEMDALPPRTETTLYSLGLAYHSDGQTYGPLPGDFGYNLHVQLFYGLPDLSEE